MPSSITTDTYSVMMTKDRENRQLKCVVSDRFGNSITSEIVTIGIAYPEGYEKPAIIEQPADASAPLGKVVSVTVVAQGRGLTYQWYYRNAREVTWSKSSITADTYSVEMTNNRNGRQLKCVITDMYGNSVTSEIVTISITRSTERVVGIKPDEYTM